MTVPASWTSVLDAILQLSGNGANRQLELWPAIVNTASPYQVTQLVIPAGFTAIAAAPVGTKWWIFVPSPGNTPNLLGIVGNTATDTPILISPTVPTILPVTAATVMSFSNPGEASTQYGTQYFV
jgi:hypothetical protein